MPEVPYITVFAKNLNKVLAGKKLEHVKVVNGRKLQDKPGEITKALTGKTLKEIYRSGKEMRFEFTDGTILGLHLMLTGDIFIYDKKNSHHSAIVEFLFEGGQGMVLTDRMGNANIKLNPVDKKGVDAMELTFRYLKEAFARKKQIKNLLTDQNIIRGIGNSYSDEILWETKISPYSIAQAIPDDKIKELVAATKSVMKEAIKLIDKNYPGKINVEVKTFLKVHTKERAETPTGATIKIDKKGMMKTYYTDEQVLYK